MIIHTKSGAVVILNQNCWNEGAYLAVSAGCGAGVMLELAELDQIDEEIGRIRAAIAQRQASQPPQRKRA
jgi:hypothetical protein